MEKGDFFKQLAINGKKIGYFDISCLENKGASDINSLPFSIRVLVENLLRKMDGRVVTEKELLKIANWQKSYDTPVEIPYHPARVLMQDFTGVPSVVDLAAMRDAVRNLNSDPEKINPLVPVELIIDHSVQVDYFGTIDALKKNVAREYDRNQERYELLKWAQKSFKNFRVVPPNSGICHQVNLEYLGRVVIQEVLPEGPVAFPDTVVGTDSHTTMINGIGVVGWGVGGIEAEAVMLGQPYYMSIPQVVGVKLTGELNNGVTATDLVLTVTELLRKENVVEKFVEYFGPGMNALSVTDRATIANMTPEYGATIGFFPVDEKTIEYLELTNRHEQAVIVDACSKAMGLFYTGNEHPEYSRLVELDLSTIEPCLAGPARPQDRIPMKDIKRKFAKVLGCQYNSDAATADLSTFMDESGSTTKRASSCIPVSQRLVDLDINGNPARLGDGSIVIAAITSCTNTSNPAVMIGAGVLAKNAVEKGLKISSHVKTSLAPGSKVVMDYLASAGLIPYLEALGFYVAGFGCTTCIGNSGPLHPSIEKAISEHDLNVASVLSGNRNFEARIHQSIKSNYLASPILVVAFAIAGRIDIDLTTEPVSIDPNGEPVYIDEIWPSEAAVKELIQQHVRQQHFRKEYAKIFEGDEFWQQMPVGEGTTFNWKKDSTYIKNPPYFDNFQPAISRPGDIEKARVLLLLGDSVTTDHISPAGAIPEHYPSGRYLIENGVSSKDFNSYGARRGNHEVMMRGTFGNIRIKNQLVKPKEGGLTLKFPEGTEKFIYDAAMEYMKENTPLIVLAGKEYGTGSSRDWAAKGTSLLGVRAVIAESYERIHRSNLVGMGILPLMFKEGESWKSLGLNGSEAFTIKGIENMKPGKILEVIAEKSDGTSVDFSVIARLDTVVDVEYYENNGILPCVLRKLTL